ncbi:LRR receptor-like serine/threonine-protein kinase GSO1 [Gastrolobium bilobum]|uniref:LRR receptor-like serine/threonine-protein kinase GSO1 n=1 Tax=Gastrolobium bilobum TaxID=150636 RepID=UPI002AB03D2C|nr:LRR receptor-like serine/threonine-protein kinase GSO1 [Gastrolobium bilobum]
MNSLLFLLPLFLLVAFPSPQPVHGNAEFRALMDLKSSLDPEDKLLESWTTDGDPCSGSFLGVACNEHHKVANISLAGRALSGRLSPAVAELKCLSGLYLNHNHLSGEIPREISNLNELVDLYLNVNNLSGSIPPEIGNLTSLQVLQLGYNQLVENIPEQMGSLKQLNALALENNSLTGQIPLSLGNLEMLRRLNLSFNNFSGVIPATLASIEHLEFLDIQNNSLTGTVPSALRRLREGFQGANNPGLCGAGFSTLRACKNNEFYVSQIGNSNNVSIYNNPPENFPKPANSQLHCNQSHCSKSRRLSHTIIEASVITITITIIFIGAGFFIFVRYRRQRQRVRNTSDSSEGQLSPNQPKEFYRRSPSPLVNLEFYYNGWDSLADGQNASGLYNEYLNYFRFNVDEVESATQYFSEANLLGKSKFLAVYKGVLRDGSLVAIRSISVTCCKTEEAELVKGLSILTSLRHENIVKMRGFCCSRSRGECFLIYDFATRGKLSQYLDMEDKAISLKKEEQATHMLEWSMRVSIIRGIAKGIEYLHSNEASKPTIVHQNISVEKVLLDHQFNPLIMDAGLPKLLADDVVFSALKVSAAMGYLAPEYITTGRFTEKSDIYAFGVIILQVLSGKTTIGGSIRMAVESFRFEDFVDTNLKGIYSKSEAAILSKLAILCTNELPDQRPTMVELIQELSMFPAHSS